MKMEIGKTIKKYMGMTGDNFVEDYTRFSGTAANLAGGYSIIKGMTQAFNQVDATGTTTDICLGAGAIVTGILCYLSANQSHNSTNEANELENVVEEVNENGEI